MERLAEIEEQMKKLQAEADEIKRQKVSAAIDQINALISQHGIKLEDLEISAKKTSKILKVKAKAKYRDPNSDDTWSGRGRKPKWMVDQMKEGKKMDDFLIEN